VNTKEFAQPSYEGWKFKSTQDQHKLFHLSRDKVANVDDHRALH